MSWPLASHFSAMLQNPRIAFRDARLKQCSILKDAQNQPRPWAGSFAVVYKGTHADTAEPFAVRVFTTESPERRERYEQISAYLKDRHLDCLCDFEYRDRSIRSAGDGKWYPLILMEWVEGETLFQWVRSKCSRGDKKALAAAASRWLEVVKELADASLAHGDLQHANVMVTTAGQLKLVDYDCMCVPALVGRRNLEVGVDPYQHPDRNESTLLSMDLDNFSALMIYLALRATAADPSLWQKHVEGPGHDKLLFSRRDFEDVAGSSLYIDLINSRDSEVQKLAEKLFRLHGGRMDRVPSLVHLAESFAKLEELLRAGQWEAAVETLNRRGQFRDAPDRLQPLIRKAYEHVCRLQAWRAFQKAAGETSEKGDRRLVDAWNESLFAGYEPAERARVQVAQARRRVEILDRLVHRLQQSPGETTLTGEQGLLEAVAGLPQGYQYSLSPRVEKARRRVGAITRLETAVESESSEAAIIAAWRAAGEVECEEMVPDEHRSRIELAERRAPLLKRLHAISDDLPAEKRSKQLAKIWDEELLGKCPEAKRWRETFEVATPSEEPLAPGDALIAALQDQQLSAFYESFDARAVRDDPERFAPHESLLAEWTRREILPPDKLGLRSRGGKSLMPVRKSVDRYKVQWIWPAERFVEQCILAVCAEEPGTEDDPETLDAAYRVTIDREAWQRDGGNRIIQVKPEWTGYYVVVWALVELGFRTFHGRPLSLGRLGTGSRWSLRNLPLFSPRDGGDRT